MFIENLKQLLAADMAAVDQVIRKRLLPALAVLSANDFAYQGKRHHDLEARQAV